MIGNKHQRDFPQLWHYRDGKQITLKNWVYNRCIEISVFALLSRYGFVTQLVVAPIYYLEAWV